MKIYTCPADGRLLYFENLRCACGADVSYDHRTEGFVEDGPACSNRKHIRCNWLAEDGGLCAACGMTRTHPDVEIGENRNLWARAEAAKRWVLVNLGRWGWFEEGDPGTRPVFDILSERTASGPAQLTMGHANGTIVINASEAEPTEITRRREEMAEPFRTMIGHFRHELAHFLQVRLAEREGFEEAFRRHFGDERADYGAALERYYASGAPADWEERHISRYAASHPHEDWAETAAHALHLSDLLHSAEAAGLVPRTTGNDAGKPPDIRDALALGLELALALNHVNRSMGLEDLYPFVVTETVREKLAFALAALSEGPVSDVDAVA